MVVLIVGATGFIGRRLVRSLGRRGHDVVCAGRKLKSAIPACRRTCVVDLANDVEPARWVPRLQGVDAVVNAAGLLRETAHQTYETVHTRAPQALFSACAEAGVRRVIQISALGASLDAPTDFLRSKAAADAFLERLPLDWAIVRPSLVYGSGGPSAQLFRKLATAPLIPLPGTGAQQVQPVHVNDVVAGIVRLLELPEMLRRVVPFVGAEPLSVRAYLSRLRGAFGRGPPRFVPVPMVLLRILATLGRCFPGLLLDSDTLRMLNAGNTGDPRPLQELLGRIPTPVEQFVAPAQRHDRVSARWRALLLPLRISIAVVWFAAGVVSLGLYPVASSLALLERIGVSRELAPLLLYGAAILDLLLGFATLMTGRRRLWLAQIALILVYTAIITIKLPELWLEPFGPVVKNLPVLAALALLYRFERR